VGGQHSGGHGKRLRDLEMQKRGAMGLVSYMTLEMVGKEDSEFESAAKKRNVVRTFFCCWVVGVQTENRRVVASD
jgi:hypothetical protein